MPVEAQRREPWDRRGETHGVFGVFVSARSMVSGEIARRVPPGLRALGLDMHAEHAVPWKPNGVSRGTGVGNRRTRTRYQPSQVRRASLNRSPMLRRVSAKSALLDPAARSVNVIGTSTMRAPAR